MIDQKKHWDKKWKRVNEELPIHNFTKRSYKLAKEKNAKTLLDIGCGNGRDSIYFADKGLNVTAVDFSKEAIEQIKKKRNNINALVTDIAKYKTTKKFDIIFANLAIQFFDDKTTTKVFNNLYTILKPKGLFIIRCKSTTDAYYKKGEKIEDNFYIYNNQKRRFFTKEYMEEKLQKFKVIRIRNNTSKHIRIMEKPVKASFIEAIATK